MKMQSWIPCRQSYIDEILALEGFPTEAESLRCSRCHLACETERTYRCLDCFGSVPFCRICILSAHSALPLHRLQVRRTYFSLSHFSTWKTQQIWNGNFFDKCSLQELGLRIQLGHQGHVCSKPLPGSSRFLVMDTSGFHHVQFDFCDCGLGPPRYIQLLRVRLLPTTTDRPQSAYTFDVLDTFEELSLQGKSNVFDFYNAICFKTDKSQPIQFVSSVR